MQLRHKEEAPEAVSVDPRAILFEGAKNIFRDRPEPEDFPEYLHPTMKKLAENIGKDKEYFFLTPMAIEQFIMRMPVRKISEEMHVVNGTTVKKTVRAEPDDEVWLSFASELTSELDRINKISGKPSETETNSRKEICFSLLYVVGAEYLGADKAEKGRFSLESIIETNKVLYSQETVRQLERIANAGTGLDVRKMLSEIYTEDAHRQLVMNSNSVAYSQAKSIFALSVALPGLIVSTYPPPLHTPANELFGAFSVAFGATGISTFLRYLTRDKARQFMTIIYSKATAKKIAAYFWPAVSAVASFEGIETLSGANPMVQNAITAAAFAAALYSTFQILVSRKRLRADQKIYKEQEKKLDTARNSLSQLIRI